MAGKERDLTAMKSLFRVNVTKSSCVVSHVDIGFISFVLEVVVLSIIRKVTFRILEFHKRSLSLPACFSLEELFFLPWEIRMVEVLTSDSLFRTLHKNSCNSEGLYEAMKLLAIVGNLSPFKCL
jgi:hypothetical protein